MAACSLISDEYSEFNQQRTATIAQECDYIYEKTNPIIGNTGEIKASGCESAMQRQPTEKDGKAMVRADVVDPNNKARSTSVEDRRSRLRVTTTNAGAHFSTPLSSLPSSGSLMRHMFELRRKQQEQRRKLEESTQTASPSLSSGNVRSRLNQRNVQDHQKDDLKGNTNIKNGTIDSISYETDNKDKSLPRLPFTELATETSNKNNVIQYIPIGGGSTSLEHDFDSKFSAMDENSTPAQCRIKVLDSPVASRNYNPSIYRSPSYTCKNNSEAENSVRLKIKRAPIKAQEMQDTTTSSSDADRPISTINKSFEELILEKLNAGVYKCSPTDTPVPKNNFLAKGSGIARFHNSNEAKHNLQNKSDPIQHEQRLNDENKLKVKFPYLKKGAGTCRFNYEPVRLKKSAKFTTPKPSIENKPVDKLTLSEPYHNDFSTPLETKSYAHLSNELKFDRPHMNEPISPIVNKYPRRELEELRAFEKLEELAENTSFSSNGSTINSLLQKGLNSTISSTPINSPISFRDRAITNIFSAPDLLPPYNKQSSAPQMQSTITNEDLPATPVNYDDLDFFAHQIAGVAYTNENLDNKSKSNNFMHDQNCAKKKRSVQFCEKGAHVLEYYVDDGDTASEAPTMSDTSEFFNASDLEVLNHLQLEGKIPKSLVSAEYVDKNVNMPCDLYAISKNFPYDSIVDDSNNDGSYDTAIGSPLKNTPLTAAVIVPDNKDVPPQRTVLQFSPPRIPPNAASYPVWEAFGKRTNKPSNLKRSEICDPKSSANSADVKQSQQNVQEIVVEQDKQTEDLEAHKILLISKVHELEKEVSTFQRENAQLTRLRETLNCEKEQLEKEKKLFEITLAEDRRKIEEYFEHEKNMLWKEKCSLRTTKQSEKKTNNALEIINLKEEILLLKKELDKRDSMHTFTVNKLKEKIKEIDNQRKDLESKAEKLTKLEKGNMSLKHQLDRMKLTKKLGYQKIPVSNPQSKPLQQYTSSKLAFKSQIDDVSIVDVNPKQRNSSFFKTVRDINLPNTSNIGATLSPCNVYFKQNINANKPMSESITGLTTSLESNGVSGGNSDFSNSLNCSETKLADGSKVLTYANGNKKHILVSGCTIHEYYNGDRKETYGDRIVYTYSETGTKQTSYHNGSEELLFLNGQKEMKRMDGSIEVLFPDSTRRCTQSDGTVVHYGLDGTVITSNVTGEKVFQFTNGQREVHGDGFKRREYPDGTRKVVYVDGTTETTYPNGRIRIKDGQDNVISDTKLGINLNQT